MRIIGGRFKGRRFRPSANKWPTRPTTDFAREALFNILENRFDFAKIKMLDLFGGTGSHTYEAISRGCRDVTYIDKHRGCHSFVNKIAKELSIEDEMHAVLGDVAKFLKTCIEKYDYIFAGPPYNLPWIDEIPAKVFCRDIISEDGLFVLEHNARHTYKHHPSFELERNYGDTHFSFFSG